jgi:hypothetical protein
VIAGLFEWRQQDFVILAPMRGPESDPVPGIGSASGLRLKWFRVGFA